MARCAQRLERRAGMRVGRASQLQPVTLGPHMVPSKGPTLTGHEPSSPGSGEIEEMKDVARSIPKHVLVCLWCSQRPLPPHSLQNLRSRPCSQMRPCMHFFIPLHFPQRVAFSSAAAAFASAAAAFSAGVFFAGAALFFACLFAAGAPPMGSLPAVKRTAGFQPDLLHALTRNQHKMPFFGMAFAVFW
jgi:hypothetical protein